MALHHGPFEARTPRTPSRPSHYAAARVVRSSPGEAARLPFSTMELRFATPRELRPDLGRLIGCLEGLQGAPPFGEVLLSAMAQPDGPGVGVAGERGRGVGGVRLHGSQPGPPYLDPRGRGRYGGLRSVPGGGPRPLGGPGSRRGRALGPLSLCRTPARPGEARATPASHGRGPARRTRPGPSRRRAAQGFRSGT